MNAINTPSACPVSQDASDWHTAMARYRALRQYSHNLAPETPDAVHDAAVDAYCTAMDDLIRKVPAPDLSCLSKKIELVRSREGMEDDYWDALTADIDRLHEKEADAPANPAIDWLARQDPFLIFEAIRAAYDAARFERDEEQDAMDEAFTSARQTMMATPPTSWDQFCILLDWVCGEDAAPIPEDLFTVRDRARALAAMKGGA